MQGLLPLTTKVHTSTQVQVTWCEPHESQALNLYLCCGSSWYKGSRSQVFLLCIFQAAGSWLQTRVVILNWGFSISADEKNGVTQEWKMKRKKKRMIELGKAKELENSDRIWNAIGFRVGVFYMEITGFDGSLRKKMWKRKGFISSDLHPQGNKWLVCNLSISLGFCCGQLYACLDYIYFTFSDSLSSLFNNISCPEDNHPLRFSSALSVSLMQHE